MMPDGAGAGITQCCVVLSHIRINTCQSPRQGSAWVDTAFALHYAPPDLPYIIAIDYHCSGNSCTHCPWMWNLTKIHVILSDKVKYFGCLLSGVTQGCMIGALLLVPLVEKETWVVKTNMSKYEGCLDMKFQVKTSFIFPIAISYSFSKELISAYQYCILYLNTLLKHS